MEFKMHTIRDVHTHKYTARVYFECTKWVHRARELVICSEQNWVKLYEICKQMNRIKFLSVNWIHTKREQQHGKHTYTHSNIRLHSSCFPNAKRKMNEPNRNNNNNHWSSIDFTDELLRGRIIVGLAMESANILAYNSKYLHVIDVSHDSEHCAAT